MKLKTTHNTWITNYLKEYKQTIQKEADRLVAQPIQKITQELYDRYEKTGDRSAFEEVYFSRRRFLAVYGMASLLFHQERDLHKLSEIIEIICSEECWALPAHVDRKVPDWKHTVELYASETAQALTEITYLLKQELSDEVKEMVQQNVEERVLHPFFDSQPPYAWWEETEMNWCAVCAGSIGITAFYLYENQPQYLDQCLERINLALEHYRNGFTSDGACMEGLDYWTYGMTYYAMFAQYQAQVTNGRKDLLRKPALRPILEFQQKCYLGKKQTLSFSDGSNHSRFRPGLTLYLKSLDPKVTIPDSASVMHLDDDGAYHWAAIYRDYEWTRRYGCELEESQIQSADQSEEQREEQQETQEYYFPEAQWVISRYKHLALAIKGGHNDEPHNHNDVGSFLYACDGIQYLSDLGAGEYTRDYFNEKRYTVFCNHAESHNIPIINHDFQQEGRLHCCTEFLYDRGNDGTQVDMNLTSAYEKDVIGQLHRKIEYQRDLTEVQVTDTFVLSESTHMITENLVTGLNAEVVENGFIISDGQGRTCKIELLTAAAGCKVIAREHKNHIGELEHISVMRWQIPFCKERCLGSKRPVVVRFRIKASQLDEK